MDDKEITDVHWTDPKTILAESLAEKLWLAPPQVYELTRMAQFESAGSLEAVCKMRKEQGCETWLPLFYKCNDGTLSCLPGNNHRMYEYSLKGSFKK